MRETRRLFWAVNLPWPVKEILIGLQMQLRHPSLDAKWVEQENLHLTLKFLGDTGAGVIPSLIEVVRQRVTGSGAFNLELSGCHTFGHPPRVLWVGVQGDVTRLRSIQRRVEMACGELGFVPEKKRYTPHLTLARLRNGSKGLPLEVAATAEKVGHLASLRVTAVDLMCSILTAQGPHYSVLGTIEL